jgi:hypothetical protein
MAVSKVISVPVLFIGSLQSANFAYEMIAAAATL